MEAIMGSLSLDKLSKMLPFAIVSGIITGLVIGFVAVKFSPMLAGAVVAGAGAGLIFMRYPDYALYFTVALIPIERFGRFTDDNTQFTISLMRIMGLVALGILAAHRLIRKQPITLGPAFYLYAGYVGVGFLSVMYTTDTLGTIRGASSILGNLLFFLVLINMLRTKKHIIISLLIWLSVSGLISAYSTYDWHYGSGRTNIVIDSQEEDRGKGVQTLENRWATVWSDRAELESLGGMNLRRSMGPTSHAAVYGINLILTIPFLLYIFRLPIHFRWKLLSLVVLGAVGYNILLTNTRAVILCAAIVGGMCLVRGLLRLTPGQYIASALIGVSLVGFIPEDVFNRILDISNYTVQNSASLRIRIEYAEAGRRAIADKPFLGSGLANENIVPEYLDTWSTAPERTTVHNEYLQTPMEVGLIGASFLAGFVGLLLYYALRAGRNFRGDPDTEQEYWLMIAIQIAMVSVLIFGAQVDVLHFPLKGWWLLTGITVSMYSMSIDHVRKKQTDLKHQLITQGA